MNIDNTWQPLVDRLRGTAYRFGLITADSPVYRIDFAKGLSDAEVHAAEERFDFRFPPDLRMFLQTALPYGPQFPDWRSGDMRKLREWLDLPGDGILFDVEHNGFWLEEWGPRPRLMHNALRLVADLVRNAPRLIPIYGHRMIPDDPYAAGNPVFSVHQTDIIHYGFDLLDYFLNEFNLPGRQPWPTQLRTIRFWEVERFQAVRWADNSEDIT